MSIAKFCDINFSSDSEISRYEIEYPATVPFEVKRIYYIFDTKSEVERGFHAHKQLYQLAVCITGACRFRLDDGTSKEDVLLDSPKKGLILGNMIWREMYDFSPDCILLVLASEPYDELDYIRDYEEFLILSSK